ncbi:hypothetical protein TRICI_001334 [Trichomonascus ciferrii]|uniref:FHA domain-containing protein n=1 Tax=Trichomonascus ciferrii TaxID=44093 RepID=A0A642V9H6_9ASCO|nr:hypothetical protein TRICI_001334 [Trichomonascus ciferrii]
MATLTMLRNTQSAGSLPLERDGSSSNNNNNGSIPQTSERKRRASQSVPSRSQYALVLVLSPLNGTFERKSLFVPFAPDLLKLGRQTSAKTIPAPDNGFFDSRVLSRQHAEVWADRTTGKVWIKDAKSSNGTYINSQRLSSDNTESKPHELRKNDILELGIDISNDDGSSLVHRKISAKVERISIMSLQSDNVPANTSSVNGSLSSSSSSSSSNGSLSRSNTLVGSSRPKLGQNKGADSLDVALFGDVDASLEDLVMGHARNSLGGLFMNSGLSSSISFETTVKKLIAQIHEAKLEGAKINSVSKLLEEISKNQSNSSVLTALTEQLASKDAYITQLEKKLESHQKRYDPERENNLTKQLTKTQDDLNETKRELDRYKSRALAAEALTSKSHETIKELVRTLEDKQKLLEKAQQQGKNEQTNDKPKQPATTNDDDPTTMASTSTTQQQQQQQQVSSFAVKAIPVSSALGVVIIGISIMSFINSYTRDR